MALDLTLGNVANTLGNAGIQSPSSAPAPKTPSTPTSSIGSTSVDPLISKLQPTPIVTPLVGPPVPPKTAPSPQVVASAAPAVTSLANTKANASAINQNVANQAQNNINTQAAAADAAAGAAATQKANADAAAAQSAQAEALNNASNAVTGGTPTSTANTTTATTETPAEQETGTTYADIQQQKDAATTTFNNSMAQLQAGTFPLTPAQQASINSTTQTYNNLITQQQEANRAAAAAASGTNIRQGLNVYAPLIAQGNIQNAVNAGLQKITTIEGDASKALSDLNTAIQQSDYTQINDSYATLQKALDDKTTALDDLNTQITNAAKQQADQANQEQTNARDAINTILTQLGGAAFSDLTPDQQAQMAQLEQQAGYPAGFIKEGMTTIAEQKNAATEAQAAATLAAKQQQDAINNQLRLMALDIQSQKAGGDLTQSDVENIIANANDYNGTKYITPSDLAGLSSVDKDLATRALAAVGIKTPSQKDADAISSIQTAQQDLTDFQSMLSGLSINPQGPVSRAVYGAGKATVEQWFQTNGQIGAFNTWMAIAIPVLSGLKGAGTTGAGGAARLFNTITDLLPHPTDTLDTANKKIAALNDLLSKGAKSILGGSPSSTAAPAGSVVQYNGQNYNVDASGNMTPVQ